MADFPDDDACARRVAQRRWPDAFVCPACDLRRAWRSETKAWTWKCANCDLQTSATASTIMHGTHLSKTIGDMAVHVQSPWIHGVFANLKRLALGVYHGFRRRRLQAYLDEFVFRWNRRRRQRVAFDVLLGIGLKTGPMSYRTAAQVAPLPGVTTLFPGSIGARRFRREHRCPARHLATRRDRRET